MNLEQQLASVCKKIFRIVLESAVEVIQEAFCSETKNSASSPQPSNVSESPPAAQPTQMTSPVVPKPVEHPKKQKNKKSSSTPEALNYTSDEREVLKAHIQSAVSRRPGLNASAIKKETGLLLNDLWVFAYQLREERKIRFAGHGWNTKFYPLGA